MIEITLEQLKDLNACEDGIQWFLDHKITRLKPLVIALLKDNNESYAYWLLSHLLTDAQNTQWAIYSAELCLPNFEKHYPGDKRPRQAIQAAKDYLAGKIDGSAARAAAESAWSAADAAESAAESAAWSATYAAESAARAAGVVLASYSANSAADSAAESAASAAADLIEAKKIIFYALKLLGE